MNPTPTTVEQKSGTILHRVAPPYMGGGQVRGVNSLSPPTAPLPHGEGEPLESGAVR
jgi:hypothetical protein